MVNNGIENTHQISMIKHSVGYILDMWTGIMIRKIINLGQHNTRRKCYRKKWAFESNV